MQVNSALHYPSGVKVLVTGSAARNLRVESEGDMVRVFYEAPLTSSRTSQQNQLQLEEQEQGGEEGDLQACVLITRE
jgi:hypothetical protein